MIKKTKMLQNLIVIILAISSIKTLGNRILTTSGPRKDCIRRILTVGTKNGCRRILGEAEYNRILTEYRRIRILI